MTEQPSETIPPMDYSKDIEEQKAAIVALNEKIKQLESKNAAAEQKIQAMTAAPQKAAAPEPELTPEQKAKAKLDACFEDILKEFGFREKKKE